MKKKIYHKRLNGSQIQDIFHFMNKPAVPRGQANALAKQFNVSEATILRIAAGLTGRRFLGRKVQPLPSGLRAFRPENRSRALQARGVATQLFTYSWLKPKASP